MGGMRTVIVTGGTGDLGSVVVPRLLREHRVIVSYRSAAAFEKMEKHERLTGLPDGAAIEEPIDALVMLAGAFALGSTAADYTAMFEANVLSAARALDTVGDRLTDGARIVAISSIHTIEPPAGLQAYVAAKSALNAIILTTARELAARHISANVLAPATLKLHGAAEGVPPANVAEAIAFLLGDGGASVTGQVIALRPS
jgi:3-oxoacyl-[acyl-carrier protein] reductase